MQGVERVCLTVSTSEITVEVQGRLARIIAYLVSQGTALDLDAVGSGKLLILWGEDWLRLRKEQDMPPIRETRD